MSKLQFDPHSPLAEYFSRTKIDGEFIKNDYGDRGEFVINSETGAISLLLKCKYTWVKNSDVKDDWTFIEKSLFIINVYTTVCSEWNGKIFFSVSGTSDFARKFQGKPLPFDIQMIPVNHGEHCDVTALKVRPGDDVRTYVIWGSRILHIDSEDVVAVRKCLDPAQTVCSNQINVPHEIGHMIGYLDDEYALDKSGKATTAYRSDAAALMNIGMELRSRYLEHVNTFLNVIIPDTYFTVMSVDK